MADELIVANPCRVRGGGQSKRVKKIVPASLAELEILTIAMPGKYKLMVLLAPWCGLWFGEFGRDAPHRCGHHQRDRARPPRGGAHQDRPQGEGPEVRGG